MKTINKPIPKKDTISNQQFLNSIWDRIKTFETIRPVDLNNISIEFVKGKVLLTGHLPNKGYKQRLESIIINTPGAPLVRNEIVVDRELKSRISQALSKDPRTRLFFIFVGASHGWVHLGGEVPTEEDQAVVGRVAASVPDVRGIVSLPNLGGKKKVYQHHSDQPSIGAIVRDRSKSLGRINQVVIDPQNRLVIGAIIEVDLQSGRETENSFYFITSNFMKLVNQVEVILDDSLPDMTSSPLFNQLEFVRPPDDWRPPYPYKSKDTLWPKGVPNV